MKPDILTGRTALVTGASSGLGEAFARELAARGCDLILVARREARLMALRDEIASRHSVRVETVSLDLSVADAPQCLYDRIKDAGLTVDVLINSAGSAMGGGFLDLPWDCERDMLAVDILALVHLTKLFGRDMAVRGFGYILQVASTGAFQPTPNYATYAAAKAFVLHFGEALSFELRRTGVGCTVLAPGAMRTEFFEVAGQPPAPYHRLTMMEPARVARIGLNAMLKRRPSVVAGGLNALMAWGGRFVPRRFATAIAAGSTDTR